jgi:uncharacterized membrane protein (UPF0127 family)
VLLLCLVLIVAGCNQPQPGNTQKAVIGSRTFTLELALTPEQRHQGLSDRRSIAAEGGMLFVFPELAPAADPGAFWMYHCYVPIDLLFLDPDGRIVTLHAMQVEPYDRPEGQLQLYPSAWPYQFVVELRGGMIQQLHLRQADRVELIGGTWDGLKQRAQ